ncbi:Tyrosine-protein kinase receptor, partial [Operophtera brumata]
NVSSETVFSRELYCVMGCNEALNTYFQKLRADSLTATSLSLTWEPTSLGNVSYLVQWRYEELLGTWQFYSNTSHSDRGKPSSPPSALRAAAPDPTRVAISWEPGPFPNGPLISYDMPASNNTLFYIFQNLAPAREYEVAVTMRNAIGEGPRALVRVSTPPLPTSIPSQQPVLILGGEHNVLAAPANDMLSDPSASEPILTPENILYKPLDLSVDWLNHHLYVLGEVYYSKEAANRQSMTPYPNWEIIRCDFGGKNQIVALSGFNSRPIHFEVDAYNGYLFYALRGLERGGLYRLDLANISNGVHHDAQPERIVRDAHLGAFTVDHAGFRILVAHLRRNTVLSVSLDGREVTDFRSNTQTPMFLSTRYIAYANGLFYWTNGKEMLTEEYHEQSDSYFHNEYPLAYNTKVIEARQVLVALRSCQPIPFPVNPPLGVQSVMGINVAKVSWSPPHLLGHQGSGAWQQWTFHLQLTHAGSGDKAYQRFLLLGREPKARCRIQFVGKTLESSPTTLHSTLLWSGPDGLLQTDLTGDNLHTLIHRSHMKNFHITDISWYRDKLYLVTNASTVMWYNTTTHERGLMHNMDNVGSMAVDWVGKKIYWSNPKQQLITRGNFDGSNREPVPIVTVAKELSIDSLGAYIYWNTGHAVEAARLNGENKMVYYPAQLFSGKQVMGLTTDLQNKWIYWLDASRAVVSDLAGKYTADLIPRVHVIAVRDPTLHAHSESLIAIPESINASSLAAAGEWRAFNVTWSPAERVNLNNTRVYYDVSLTFADLNKIERAFNVTWSPERVNLNNTRVYYDVSLAFADLNKIERAFNVTWSPAERVNLNNTRVYYDVSLAFADLNKIEVRVARLQRDVVPRRSRQPEQHQGLLRRQPRLRRPEQDR